MQESEIENKGLDYTTRELLSKAGRGKADKIPHPNRRPKTRLEDK